MADVNVTVKTRICSIPIPAVPNACWVNAESASYHIRDAQIIAKMIDDALINSDPGSAKDLERAREKIYVLGDQLRRELKKSYKITKALTTRLMEVRGVV